MLRRLKPTSQKIRKRSPKNYRIRSYYAAMGKNVQPMPARVVPISADMAPYLEEVAGNRRGPLEAGVALQINVPNRYMPKSYDKEGVWIDGKPAQIFSDKKILSYLEENRGETHTWSTMLFMEKSGRLYLNPYMCISDELMQRYENNSKYNMAQGAAYSTMLQPYTDHTSEYHSDFYFPNLLFSIPRYTWNDFIAKLPHQNVVSNLNLSEHRHLWVAYNYSSRNDNLINQYRSESIGEYHFLASIVANASCDDEYLDWAYGTCPLGYWLISGCRDSAQYFYTDNLHSRYDNKRKMEIDLNFFNVFKQIDQGTKPNTILTNRLPYLTPLFLNKFSQCPLWHHVHNIGLNFILPKISDESGEVNKKQLDGFIADLPSSKADPLNFSKMVMDSQKMLTKHLSTNTSSAFFYHARSNFGHFNLNEKELIEIRDYIETLVKDLIFPEVMRTLQHLSPEQCKKMEIDIAATLKDRNILNECLNKLRQFLEKVIMSVHTDKLNKLQQRWHRNITQIDAHKPVSHFKLAWHALFEKQTIGTITFTCLTNNTQLKTEGDEMHHCVSGYTSKCLGGRSHIVKVTAQSGECSTLELTVNEYTKKIEMLQNRSVHDEQPCEEIELAVKQLLLNLNNGNITINPNQGGISFKEMPAAANEIYPYFFSDTDTQEAIYKAYKDNKVLPAYLIANNYHDMLTKNNIITFIQNHLLELIQGMKTDYSVYDISNRKLV